MSLYVLDTDTLSLYQQGHAAVVRNILTHLSDEQAITIITADEQIAGRYAVLRRARRPDELARAYGWLGQTIESLGEWRILPFTVAAIARYESLRSLNLNVGKYDLRIAAIVLENRGIAVTRNVRDFQRVPNLTVENWAV